MIIRTLGVISIAILLSCTAESEKQKPESWPVNFSKLVELHCEARNLKDERYALADSMRLGMAATSQDSVVRKERMQELQAKKKNLASESFVLADTIRLRMKRVMTELGPEEKRVFNDSLQTMIKLRCRE
jgi:hypothetical protein